MDDATNPSATLPSRSLGSASVDLSDNASVRELLDAEGDAAYGDLRVSD